MELFRKGLLILMSLAFTHQVFSQAPSISYSPSSNTLTAGVAVTISPTNSGGAVPATTYGQVSTFAGSIYESSGYTNATGTAALFNLPKRMVMDASRNIYLADKSNNAIRMITPAGVVTTFAGSTTGASGYTDATGTSALFNGPVGMTIDASGNLFVADYNNNVIRKITSAGVVSTFYSLSGMGPSGICFDSSGNLIVAAQALSKILKITPAGVATTVAGNYYGYANGTGTAALFENPADVQMDPSGNMIVADYLNNAIRKITPAGVVTTIAGSTVSGNTGDFLDGVGTAARFNNPTGVAITQGGVIYVTDFVNHDIRRIMPDGTVTLIAGSPTHVASTTDGVGTAATFHSPISIYVDNTGVAYVVDMWASVRKLVLTGYTLSGTLPPGLVFDSTTGTISGTPTGPFPSQTIAVTAYNASGYSSTTLSLTGSAAQRPNISYDAIADTIAIGVPYTLSPLSLGGTVPATTYAQASTYVGSTSASSGYTNATGTSARFNAPAASVGDLYGNLYVADASNNAIRKIDPSGTVTTFAGSSTGASGYTDASGTSARFSGPGGIAMDASGNLFVSDYGNNAIREITTGGVASTFYHSTGTFGPAGLLVDASGNIIVAAKDLHQILKITPAGTVSTIAGSTSGYTNANGSSAQFYGPNDVKMDASGNLFVADRLNNAIRQIDPTGNVTTFAGSATSGNTGAYIDDVGTAARFNSPAGLAIAPGGVIYVADLGNNSIRRITPDGTVAFVAGSPTQAAGNTDGIGAAAAFNQPGNIYLDNSVTAYITEVAGNRMRKFPLTGYSLAGALPTGLTMNPATGVISGTVTGSFSGRILAVNAFNTGGFFPTLVPLGGTSFIDWKGTTSTDWGTAANWTPARVPQSSDNVRIGVAVAYSANQPTLSTTTKVASVAFGPMESTPLTKPVLTILGGSTLTSSSAITIGANTTAEVDGPGSLLLFGNNLIPATGTFTIAKSLALQFNVLAFLTINNSAVGSFTIGSDQNGSASIGAITSGQITGVGAGSVSVQRYISGDGVTAAYRGYRLLSSPVYAATVSGINVYSLNYLQSNTYLTGSGGTGGGFDQSGNPTMYIYREDLPTCNSTFICGAFQGIANMNQSPVYNYLLEPYSVSATPYTQSYNIPVGTGYLFFFRGPKTKMTDNGRDPFSSTSVPYDATLVTTGTLNQGSISFHYWLNGSSNFSYTPAGQNGFNLVGNPYPCTIDLNTFSSTLSTAGIYGLGLGNQVSEFNQLTHSYETYDLGLQTGNGHATQYIASGQGFFITALSTSASLTFNESAKAPSAQLAYGSTLLLSKSPVENNNYQYLRLQMNADSVYGEDIMIWFDAKNKMTFEPAMDAIYRKGFNKVSLSSWSSDGVALEINKQPLPGSERRVIALNTDATESGTYHFKLRKVVSLPKLYDIWLIDAYKKDSVNLRAKNTYDFTINKSDNASFGANRFSLVINQNPALAYKLLDFTANKLQTARQVQTVWKTQNEENYTNFTVERSTDGGKTFEVLGGVKAAGEGRYSFIDKNPLLGLNQYRLKQEDLNNTISYSKVVLIEYTDKGDQLAGSKLTIYPNPASSTINLVIAADGTESSTYKIRFADAMGTVVKEATSSQPSWQGNISNLLPGTYLVRVINDKTQSLVAESKFVKL